jgi:hypothetical protein
VGDEELNESSPDNLNLNAEELPEHDRSVHDSDSLNASGILPQESQEEAKHNQDESLESSIHREIEHEEADEEIGRQSAPVDSLNVSAIEEINESSSDIHLSYTNLAKSMLEKRSLSSRSLSSSMSSQSQEQELEVARKGEEQLNESEILSNEVQPELSDEPVDPVEQAKEDLNESSLSEIQIEEKIANIVSSINNLNQRLDESNLSEEVLSESKEVDSNEPVGDELEKIHETETNNQTFESNPEEQIEPEKEEKHHVLSDSLNADEAGENAAKGEDESELNEDEMLDKVIDLYSKLVEASPSENNEVSQTSDADTSNGLVEYYIKLLFFIFFKYKTE